ncbi:MAG: hypothetical protein IJX76_02225 [Clostridia bacterium]|nr:hypothetical protein [Clostridia bacterium]
MPDTYEMYEARTLFAAGQYEDALAELNEIPESARDAVWYAFRSEIEDKLERYYDALHSLRIAIELAPKNKVYKERLKEYRKKLKMQSADSSENKHCTKARCGELMKEGCGECCAELCCAGTCECLCEGLGGCG